MSGLVLQTKSNKKPLHSNKKFFSLRATRTKKYLFFLILIIILTIPLFIANHRILRVKADASTSFSFTAGGDIGRNRNTSTTLHLIAQSGSNFHLPLGDLSYSYLPPESTWRPYVPTRVASSLPVAL